MKYSKIKTKTQKEIYMYSPHSNNPIKAPIEKLVKENVAPLETTYGDKIFIEALVNEDKKLLFTVQETSNNNFVISLIETFIFNEGEFKTKADENQKIWQYIEGITICDAVKSYCDEKLKYSVLEVTVTVDTTDVTSCMNKVH